jgi:hypothetical protein
MRHDFKAALARVHSDYAFYVHCQSDPESALADYELSPEERSALSDPDRLADALQRGRDAMRFPSITIKISGTHDWVNRAAPQKEGEVDELIAREVASIKRADNDDERGQSTLRLIQLLG